VRALREPRAPARPAPPRNNPPDILQRAVGCVIALAKDDNAIAPTTAVDRHAGAAAPWRPAGASASVRAALPPDLELQYETAGEMLFKNDAMRALDRVRPGRRGGGGGGRVL
jgi:hypothetical protein